MDDNTKKQLEKLDKIPEEYFIRDVLPINGGLITLVKPQQPYFYDDLKDGRHYEDEPIDYFPDVDNIEVEISK